MRLAEEKKEVENGRKADAKVEKSSGESLHVEGKGRRTGQRKGVQQEGRGLERNVKWGKWNVRREGVKGVRP